MFVTGFIKIAAPLPMRVAPKLLEVAENSAPVKNVPFFNPRMPAPKNQPPEAFGIPSFNPRAKPVAAAPLPPETYGIQSFNPRAMSAPTAAPQQPTQVASRFVPPGAMTSNTLRRPAPPSPATYGVQSYNPRSGAAPLPATQSPRMPKLQPQMQAPQQVPQMPAQNKAFKPAQSFARTNARPRPRPIYA